MKKIVAFVVCFAILMAFSSIALASSGSDYTSNASLAEKLDNLINTGVRLFSISNTYKVGSTFSADATFYWNGDNGKQCYAYGNAAYTYLFGESPGNGERNYTKSKKISGVSGKKALNFDLLSSKGVGCGAVLRTTSPHTMIILSYNVSTITILHAVRKSQNKESPDYHLYIIKLEELGWDKFNNERLKTISVDYILQPNLTAGDVTEILPEVPEMTDGTAPTAISNGSSFSLKGTITCKYNLTEVRGTIYNCTTGAKIFDVAVNPNTTSYTLGTSGEVINSGLKFGDPRLNNSWCRYELKVTYNKNGTSCIKRVYDRYFKVGSPANMVLAQPGVYEFACDEEARSGPAESNSIVKKYNKGDIVFVTGYEINASNNVWLKLTDGSYVFSGDLNHVTWTETTINKTYTFISYAEAKKYPYSAATTITTYASGTEAYVTARATNTNGETWYRLNNDSYVPTSYMREGTSAAPTLTIPSTKSITMGQRSIISATGNYSSLVWSTSDSSVAMISNDGYVFGNKPGTATITATADGTTSKTCVVTVGQPTSDSTTFNYGSQKSGSINSDNIRAWIFDVTPSSSGYYVFESRFYDSDTIGFVYDSSWNLIASDDDSGEGFRFKVQVYLYAGTKYYLVGRFYDVSTSGDFALGFYRDEQTISIPSGITVELGYRKSAALSISSPTSYNWTSSDTSIAKVDSNGYVHGVGLGKCTITVTSASNSNNTAQCTITVTTPGVIDTMWGIGNAYYTIQSDSERRAIIQKYTPDKTCVYQLWSTGDTDTLCKVYDNLWNVYRQDDDSGEGSNFSIDAVLYEGQTYYIFVAPYSPQNTTTLRYYLDREASEINVDTYTSVTVDESYLSKCYKFVPSESATYAFYSEGGTDSLGYIYNSVWSLLASNDDGGADRNFFTTYDLTAGQTYYLETKLWSDATGSYTVFIEKNRPVSDIYFGSGNVILGTSELLWAYPATTDGSSASSKGYYFDSIDDEVCTVTWDGVVSGKKRGISSTTVYSKSNPEISHTVPIYVHDAFNFTCEASTDSNGRVILNFNSGAASNNYFSGYDLCFEDLDSWFEPVNCEIIYKQTVMENYTWDGGQGIFLHEKSGTNSISASHMANFCLLPSNFEMLWGTTKQYKFRILIDVSLNGSHYTMTNSDLFIVTVSFPQKPTPLTVPDLILPTALKTIDDEAFFGIFAKQVKLPEGTKKIGHKSFAQCKYLNIYIPSSCTSIASDAFEGDTDLTIYGKSGSYAQTYANQYGYTFIPVN